MTLYGLFADILDYPERRPDRSVGECLSRLGLKDAAAANSLRSFQARQSSIEPGKLQELYTDTFDLMPDCSLNLGHQLFGEDNRRSSFMANLAGRYRAADFRFAGELPDHLCVVLRFLAKRGEGSEAEELIRECLIPALSRLVPRVSEEANPYRAALDALLIWLRKTS